MTSAVQNFPNNDEVNFFGEILNNEKHPLKARFRALFALRNLACDRSVAWIGKCFNDPSALLKHELAYCLGQTQNPTAIDILKQVLMDEKQEIIVRHEAGEALGAIGLTSTTEVLKRYIDSEYQELAETCQLAAKRILWLNGERKDDGMVAKSPYNSVDPTPASLDEDVEKLESTLIDTSKDLWDRYRAMFALRNLRTDRSIKALARGLYCTDSALFRHEVAYTLGQACLPVAIEELRYGLERPEENPMVRHECAEALGSIATDECREILEKYLHDDERVVRESCIVALDMADYENNGDFQYLPAV